MENAMMIIMKGILKQYTRGNKSKKKKKKNARSQSENIIYLNTTVVRLHLLTSVFGRKFSLFSHCRCALRFSFSLSHARL